MGKDVRVKQKVSALCNKCLFELGDGSYWTEGAIKAHENHCGGKMSVWVSIIEDADNILSEE